jgi:hypothetical protein
MAVTDRDSTTTDASASSASREPVVPTRNVAGEPGARLPYKTPRLRHLGSVRDITLGTSHKAGEGGMRT